MDEIWRRAVKDWVDETQQSRPVLVMKGNDDWSRRQLGQIFLVFTSEEMNEEMCYKFCQFTIIKVEIYRPPQQTLGIVLRKVYVIAHVASPHFTPKGGSVEQIESASSSAK